MGRAYQYTKNILRIAVIVVLILLIPLFGDFFIAGWNWDILDFISMGALLFITGLAIDFAIQKITNPVYRVITVTIIVLALLAVWSELAVDAVSQLAHFLFAQ